MLDFTTIEFTLNDLESRYNATSEVVVQVYCSKLAVLEFGGWVEETVDNIVRQYISNKHISNDDVNKLIKNKITVTHGFKFEVLSNLLCMALGAKVWDNLLNDLDQKGYLESFKNMLNISAQKRNDAAHANISSMRTYDSPSIILNNFRMVKPIIGYIDNYIGTL